jgi:O-antigen ligase
MFTDHPILGVGIGNYDHAYADYQVAPVWIYSLGHAHNYYINIAAEAGIVGLIAFLYFLASTVGLCLRLWRSAITPWGRVVGLGALGIIVTTAVQNFFDDVFVHGMEVQIALVMALVALAERYGPQVDAAVDGDRQTTAAQGRPGMGSDTERTAATRAVPRLAAAKKEGP